MPEDEKKVLPKDFDSDYSIPGRFEESNSEYFDTEDFDTKYSSAIRPTSKKLEDVLNSLAPKATPKSRREKAMP